MASADDLARRVARLEQLLERLERSRLANEPRSDPPTDSASRLQEVAALVRERAELSDVDAGDRIAMRALLEEYRVITATVRSQTADVHRRLEQLARDTARIAAALPAREDLT